jgi:hypothetical protein
MAACPHRWWPLVLAVAMCGGCVGDGILAPTQGSQNSSEPACVANGAKDGTETDVDCGGGCDQCLDGQMCVVDDDCLSGVCTDRACAGGDQGSGGVGGDGATGGAGGTAGSAGSSGSGGSSGGPTCTDGVKNQDETDVDCGGTICDPCADGKHCADDPDCVSFLCVSGVCTTDTGGSGGSGGTGGTGGSGGGSGGMCGALGQSCTPATATMPGTCCTGLACAGANSTCCAALLQACVVGAGQCCPGDACVASRCCRQVNQYCAHDYQCCSGVCRNAACCVPAGGGCSHDYQCCSGACTLGKCK